MPQEPLLELLPLLVPPVLLPLLEFPLLLLQPLLLQLQSPLQKIRFQRGLITQQLRA
jgi:hypothetical protein